MIKILLTALLLCGIAYGQCPASDTVTANIATITSSTSATVTGNVPVNDSISGNRVVYVRVGQTDTLRSPFFSSPMNLAGLVPGGTYRYYWQTRCSNGTVFLISQMGIYTFTLTPAIIYTPQAAAGYQFKYGKFDSGFNVPYLDASLRRGVDRPGAIVYKPGNGFMGYKEGNVWGSLGGGNGVGLVTDPVQADSISADSSRIKIRQSFLDSIRNNLFAGATVWNLTGNSGTDPTVNFIGPTDRDSFYMKVHGTDVAFFDNINLNTAIGYGAGNTLGGTDNIVIGENAAIGATFTQSNVIGELAGVGSSGDLMNAIGEQAAQNAAGDNINAFGANAGQDTKSSNAVYIGNSAISNVDSTFTNVSAIGPYAYVAQSNSMVLGSIAGVNGASESVNVGIGTTTPTAKLQVAASDSNVISTSRLSNTILSSDSMVVRDSATGNFKVAAKPTFSRIVTTLTATAGQTAFTFTSVPVSYDDYDIYRNGVWQQHTLYTASGNIVTFGSGVDNGDKITYRRIF